ncbi:MAG: TonB-dependent receptor [Parahaliea sp.]
MNSKLFIRYPLTLTVAAAIGINANAQGLMLEEVTVTASPIKDSQAASIEAKRLADNIVDIISADTIGQFPDQNLADSLGRLPGLAVERDQGQARYINLRGAPFRYTTIAFDGIDVPGAENGRIPRFDSFPSVITSRLEANKAILPNMPGESVAGLINIHTFSPFDKEGLSFAPDIGFGTQELGDGDIDKYGLRLSWSNDNFGIMLFNSKNSREQITDNREYDLERNANGELVVNSLDFRSYKITREDKAYGGTLEYRSEGNIKRIFLNNLYSEFQDHEQRNQFTFDAVEPQTGAKADHVPFIVGRRLEKGLYENSTNTSTLGVDFNAGQWQIEARANYTETEFSMDLPMPTSSDGLITGSYDLSDIEDPKLYLDTPLSEVEYANSMGLLYVQNLDIEAGKFKFDASRDVNWFGEFSTLSLGFQYDNRDSKGFVATPIITNPFPENIDIGSYDTGKLWDTNTSNTIGGSYYDNDALLNAWQQNNGFSINGKIKESDKIAIEEDILAAYIMLRTDLGWGNIIGGVRVEQTDYSSQGTMNGERISVDDRFTHILPSLHFNIDLAEDLKWRISGTTGINRPTYNEWRAAASIDIAEEEVRGGNPTLEAEEAIGVDTSLEWYFAPASILSVGAFYRNVDNVIYSDISTIDGGLYYAPATGERWTFEGAVNGDDGRMKGLEFNAVALTDQWLPTPFDGLGISANITLMDSEFKTIDGRRLDMPGTSDMLYNISLFYEKYDLSVRLNYQYRDEWVSPIEDPEEIWDEQQRLDLSIVYTLPWDIQGASVSFYANANNLTDETDVRFASNGTVNQVESYGRRYLFGMRVNY